MVAFQSQRRSIYGLSSQRITICGSISNIREEECMVVNLQLLYESTAS